MSRYAKMIVALVGAACTWATTYFPTNHTVAIVVGLASALATVVAVYAVPNAPAATSAKKYRLKGTDTTGAADAWLLIALLVIAALVLGAGVSWWFLLLLVLVVLVLVRG